jgi:hypothetical protein
MCTVFCVLDILWFSAPAPRHVAQKLCSASPRPIVNVTLVQWEIDNSPPLQGAP